jgi:hypothetical protein
MDRQVDEKTNGQKVRLTEGQAKRQVKRERERERETDRQTD